MNDPKIVDSIIVNVQENHDSSSDLVQEEVKDQTSHKTGECDNIESDKCKEVVIKAGDEDYHGKELTSKVGRYYLVYGFYGEQNTPVIWVNYETGAEPLDYEPESRNSFVRCVFLILFIMLLVTFGFTAAVIISETLHEIFYNNFLIIMLVSFGVLLCIMFLMAYVDEARHPPCCWFVLIIVVVAMSCKAAVVSVRYSPFVIIMALVSTTIVVLICMLIAFSNVDFTRWYLVFVVAANAFCVVALVVVVAMFLLRIQLTLVHLIILFISTMILCMAIILDLQTILGGKSIELKEDEYAYGAYKLYISIVDLFLHLVRIIGIFNR